MGARTWISVCVQTTALENELDFGHNVLKNTVRRNLLLQDCNVEQLLYE